MNKDEWSWKLNDEQWKRIVDQSKNNSGTLNNEWWTTSNELGSMINEEWMMNYEQVSIINEQWMMNND